MIGFSRSAFLIRTGRRESIAPGSWSGVKVGSPVTLPAGDERRAVVNVLRDAMDTAGTTLTLRVYRSVGGVRGPLVQQGTVATGPTTHKGSTVNSPALPDLAGPQFADGEFEIETETSGGLVYSAEFAEVS